MKAEIPSFMSLFLIEYLHVQALRPCHIRAMKTRRVMRLKEGSQAPWEPWESLLAGAGGYSLQ